MNLPPANGMAMHIKRFEGAFVGAGEEVEINFDGDGIMIQTMPSGEYSLRSPQGDIIELPVRMCWHPRGGYRYFKLVNTGANPTASYDVVCWTGQLFPVPL